MTLPASGPLSMSQIQAEFPGRGNNLSGYYGVASGIPASGAISFSQFYGRQGNFTLTISANSVTPNIPQLAAAAGWDGNSQLTVNITAALINSLRVESTWNFPRGLIINISVGTRVGGVAGTGGGYGGRGGAGGTALYVRKACTINCSGVLSGGGGGGGSGRGMYAEYTVTNTRLWGHGGVGGDGQGFAAVNSLAIIGPAVGAAGTRDEYTGVTTGGTRPFAQGGPGGGGGAWGTGGDFGPFLDASYGGANTIGDVWYDYGYGGAAGNAVDGNGYITWGATGSRLGPII